MKKRWVWISRQADPNDQVFSALACLETVACTMIFISFLFFWGWGNWLLAILITPIFFLRSPESAVSTREYFERAVRRPHRFQLYGMLAAIVLARIDPPLWVWIIGVPIGSVGFGILFNAWYVQFSRSIIYFRQGIKCLPNNYYTALFVTDVTTTPEMFPGSAGVNAIPHWKHSIFFFPKPRNPVTFILSILWTIPLIGVIFLRFLAKASALIYLPVVYISWPANLLKDLEQQRIWIKSQSAKSIELLRFFLAFFFVAFFLLSVIDESALSTRSLFMSRENPLGIFVELYFITDFSRIMPWHYVSLISSSLSIVLYFLMDSCRKEAIAGRENFKSVIRFIILGVKLRSLLSVIWVSIAIVFTLKFYHSKCNIHEGVVYKILSYFFGDTCATM